MTTYYAKKGNKTKTKKKRKKKNPKKKQKHTNNVKELRIQQRKWLWVIKQSEVVTIQKNNINKKNRKHNIVTRIELRL